MRNHRRVEECVCRFDWHDDATVERSVRGVGVQASASPQTWKGSRTLHLRRGRVRLRFTSDVEGFASASPQTWKGSRTLFLSRGALRVRLGRDVARSVAENGRDAVRYAGELSRRAATYVRRSVRGAGAYVRRSVRGVRGLACLDFGEAEPVQPAFWPGARAAQAAVAPTRAQPARKVAILGAIFELSPEGKNTLFLRCFLMRFPGSSS